MRIVFIGSTKFSLRCLTAIKDLPSCEIVGVVTAPRVFKISYRPEGVTNLLFADISTYATVFGWPCETIGDEGMRSSALFQRFAKWRPEVIIVAGWYHMVPKTWRKVAPAFGLHASLLPDYSGGAPLVWAIINGEKRTGISLFQLGDGVDDGPLLGQAGTEISDDDNIATLYNRVEDLGIKLLQTHLPQLAAGSAVLQPQDEKRRRVFPQRSPVDGHIDWNWPAMRVYDFIRAQTRPYPGAFTQCGNHQVTIWCARVAADDIGALPGRARLSKGHIFVGCGNQTVVELLDLALDGVDKPVSNVAELLLSHALA